MNIECLECGASIEPATRVGIGDIVECPECALAMEVVDTDPLTVEAIEEAEADESGTEARLGEEEEWIQ
jgi:lysine biosynthesis protein LysW